MFSRNTSRLRDRGNVLRASVDARVEALEVRQFLSAAPAVDLATTPNPGGAPNAPFALQTHLNDFPSGGVSLSFYDSADNETGFVVERATSADGPFAPIATLGPSPGAYARVGYIDNSTAGGSTYYYTVQAVNGPYQSSAPSAVKAATFADGGGDNGGGSTTTNPGGAPNAPFGLAASANPSGGATFSFYNGATNETGFVIERATSLDGPFTQIATVGPAPFFVQVSYNDATAAASTNYYYRAYAVNGPYASSTPAAVSVTTGGQSSSQAPSAPYGLTAVATSPTTIQVSFFNSASNETRFVISRSYGANGIDYVPISQVAAVGEQITYDFNDATPGVTYSFQVRAENDAGISGYTAPVSVTAPFTEPAGTIEADPNFGTGGDLKEPDLAGGTRTALSPDGKSLYTLTAFTTAGSDGYTGPVLSRATTNASGLIESQRIEMNTLLRQPFDQVKGVAVQADGKVIVAGNAGGSIVVARFNADGSLDTTFGNAGGEEVVDFAGNEVVADVAVAADGKIYVGGMHGVYQSDMQEFFAVRLNADGSLDGSYGYGGISKGDPQAGLVATSIALDPNDDSVVVAGESIDPATHFDPNAEAARLLATGSAGTRYTLAGDFRGADADDVLVQPDDKIVMVGENDLNCFTQRFNADGTIDATWVDAGSAAASPSIDVVGSLNAIARLPDGSFVVVGSGSPDFVQSNGLVAHLRADGSLDPSGGGTGGVVLKAQSPPASAGTPDIVYRDVAISADGSKFCAAGHDQSALLVSAYDFAS